MTGDWVEIPGVVERGHGVASGSAVDSPYPRGTIEMQTPFFEALGLDLSGFHPATLNISIAPRTFRMAAPAFTFRQVGWTPLIPPEDFDFSRCRLVFNRRRFDALVYFPHPETKIQHFQPASTIEVLAPFVSGIQPGMNVRLELNGREIHISEEPGS